MDFVRPQVVRTVPAVMLACRFFISLRRMPTPCNLIVALLAVSFAPPAPVNLIPPAFSAEAEMVTPRSARHGDPAGGAVHLTSIFTSAPSLPTISLDVTFTVGLDVEVALDLTMTEPAFTSDRLMLRLRMLPRTTTAAEVAFAPTFTSPDSTVLLFFSTSRADRLSSHVRSTWQPFSQLL